MNYFTSDPISVEEVGIGQWKLLKPILYSPDGIHIIGVPPGFITDFGSVPKLFRNVIEGIGTEQDKAYILHDWLYATEYYSWSKAYRNVMPSTDRSANRVACDWELLCACQYCGVNWFARNSIYAAVRMFGSAVWGAHTILSVNETRMIYSNWKQFDLLP